MDIIKNSCINFEQKNLYEIFNENTGLSKENAGVFLHYITSAMESGYISCIKGYEGFSDYIKINISDYGKGFIDDVKLSDVLLSRRSCRCFNDKFATLDEIATILKYSCCASFKSENNFYFNYPISGGIDSFYFIVIVNKVYGIDSGIYLYNSVDSELILLSKGFEYLEYRNITASISLTKNCCFSIHILADTKIKCLKYQDRGYRFLNLEAGHVAQNLCLVAEAIDVGSVVSGGFLDLEFLDYLKRRNIKDSFSHKCILLYEIFFGKFDF